MEQLDIVDENGMPTGKIVDREEAHRMGIRHRTSHVWIFRKKESELQILLQKRSQGKDSNPGCYDISSAGHIPAGVDFIPSALREMREELGIVIDEKDLVYCGQRRFYYEEEFHGGLFRDNQISNVYLTFLDKEIEEFTLQYEEIESICWMGFEECIHAVTQVEIKNCIQLEELNILKKKLIEIGMI